MSMPIRSLLLLLFGVFVVMTAFAEDTLNVSRKVLMPNGTSAAGAMVTIRTYGDDEKLLQETVTKTDVNGMVNATVKYSYPSSVMPMGQMSAGATSNGYMIVDMPGCALSFAKLVTKNSTAENNMDGRDNGNDASTLKLMADYQQKGIVLDKETNLPVKDAKVSLIGLVQTIKVNTGAPAISTPSMVTTTAADGTFLFRGVTAESLGGFGMPYLSGTAPGMIVASVKVDGKTKVGENTSFIFMPQPRDPVQKVLLEPTTSLSGKVINRVTGKSLNGVNVHVMAGRSLWSHTLPVCITNNEGEYSYPVISRAGSMYVLSNVNGYTNGLVSVGAVGGSYRGNPQSLPEKITAPDIAMSPMGPVTTIKAVDAVTGKAPETTLRLGVTFSESIRDDIIGWIYGTTSYTNTKPDGTASSVMPIGNISISLFGQGYQCKTTINVPAKGVITVPVDRRNGILIRFNAKNPDDLANCRPHIHGGDGKELNSSINGAPISADGTWFFELWRPPAGPFSVQVIKNNQEIVPWTEVKPEVWPNVIEVK